MMTPREKSILLIVAAVSAVIAVLVVTAVIFSHYDPGFWHKLSGN